MFCTMCHNAIYSTAVTDLSRIMAELQVLAARRKERLENLKQELERKHPGIQIRTFELDVRARAKVQETAAQIGDVDVLVNNAGESRLVNNCTLHVTHKATIFSYILSFLPPYFLK